jgi:hypothetical protein
MRSIAFQAAVLIELQWPIEPLPQRAASFMWVDVKDPGQPASVARCSPIMTHLLDLDFSTDPLARPRLISNSIRRAVDRQELKFYATDAHPRELQTIDVQPEQGDGSIGITEIENFLCGKVYWVGFRMSTGLEPVPAWIVDPWDALYLGTEEKNLAQAARLAQAKGLIKVDDQGFAIAQDELLRNARQYEGTATRRPVRVFVSGSGKTARFIEEILRPASVSAPCKIRFSSRPSTSMHVATCMSSDELDIRI